VSLASDLFDTLGPLVQGRAYRTAFPQPATLPEWPAIRFHFISALSESTVCGTGLEDSDDVIVQIDVVHTSAKLLDALVTQVVAAMQNYPEPVTRGARRDDPYEPTTKTFRASLDYTISLSA
jgi:hypothetical protein